eukprot:5015180-Pleurochrysis_carterae.AAC.2
MSLLMRDPASHPSESARGRGPDHAAQSASSARSASKFSIYRQRYFRPCANSFFSMASTTCTAVPPGMMKAPRNTMSMVAPLAVSPCTLVFSVPIWNLLVSSKPKLTSLLS